MSTEEKICGYDWDYLAIESICDIFAIISGYRMQSGGFLVDILYDDFLQNYKVPFRVIQGLLWSIFYILTYYFIVNM